MIVKCIIVANFTSILYFFVKQSIVNLIVGLVYIDNVLVFA